MDLPIFYDEAEAWSNTLLLYDAALKEVNTRLEILNKEFKLLHRHNPIEHITSRLKSPESIAKKLRRYSLELTVENIKKYINDVAGIRVICSYTSDIYRIADLIARQNDIKVLKVKDYIKHPKENGYTSYHMIISVPIYLSDSITETKVEIQIRTIAMDFWASLEHKIYYKYEGKAPEHIKKDLKECSELVSYLDKKMFSLSEEIKKLGKEDGYDRELSEGFSSVVADVAGTIVDEQEKGALKTGSKTEEEGKAKPKGKKRILFGLGT
jgi:putative GTP pyrophosphokinase